MLLPLNADQLVIEKRKMLGADRTCLGKNVIIIIACALLGV